jgi:hypothetical protein
MDIYWHDCQAGDYNLVGMYLHDFLAGGHNLVDRCWHDYLAAGRSLQSYILLYWNLFYLDICLM